MQSPVRRSFVMMGLGLLAGMILMPGPGRAQTIVSMGKGWAHDCFVAAKTGLDSVAGVAVCDQALV